MAQFHTRIPVDLAMAPHALTLPHQLALKDHQSFNLTALVYDSRAEVPAEVMAGTVTGHALRPDGATVELIGAKGAALEQVTDARGNAWMATPCTVTVPQTALNIPGRLLLSIMLSEGETVNTTVLQASLTVNRTNSDQIVDGGEVIITIDTLVAQVNAASETATQAAADAQSALAQATNIVSYAEQTGKTDAEKAQARTNIGAVSEAELQAAMDEHFPATGKLQAGVGTSAAANGAVATGVGTTASGRASHAEGQLTTADGQVAHAEGYGTTASGDYSHAEGFGTKASGDHQHAFGKYNVEDTNDTYLEIAGNGTGDNARSNARTLDWNGNEALAGDLTVNKGTASEMALGQEVSSLKSVVNLSFMRDDLGFAVTSGLLELGRIDDSGNPVAHSSRCRTKYFLPVSKGDTIVPVADNNAGNRAVIVAYYDVAKTFINSTSWYYFKSNYDTYPVAENDGFIKLTFSTAVMTDYDKRVRISRTSKSFEDLIALQTKQGGNILPIPSELLVYGYWTTAISYRVDSTRATLKYPIAVNSGDEIHFTSKNEHSVDIGFAEYESTSMSMRGYSNKPFKCPSKGYVYLMFRKADNTDITDFSEFDKAITVKRASDICSVETTQASDLYNGYINSSEAIADHATRLVNWNPIHANKGDIIRINNMNLMYQPYEYNSAGQRLTNASTYITPTYVGGSYPLCGDYVVQNDDCWIMVVVAPTYGFTPSSFKPSDYPSPFSVIHIEKDRCINTAEDTYFRFPKSARKPIPFETSAVVSQAATIVKGKMWAAVDDTTDYFQVVNLETGEVERTISHNLGHCNSLDYCEKTDTLLTVDSTTNYQTILLYPNASNAQSSIAKADCISIPVSSDVISQMASCCFGQDHREILIYCGYGSTTPYNLYKMVLGYANGSYDGTVTMKKTYTGVIRDNIDTYVTTGTTGYSQDCCYDGYYYLGYGTSGHNFLVIDLDDVHNTYKVVGNYLHHEYKDDYTEYGVEPEGVFIDDSRIYCLSRQNTAHLSFFNIFTR